LHTVQMIHESDVRFNIKFTIRGKIQGRKFLGMNVVNGELYIVENDIYLGEGRKWYRLSLTDLHEVVNLGVDGMKMSFPDYEVKIYSENRHHLRAIQYMLMMYTMTSHSGTAIMGGAA
jgi:hypothetical protein